MPDLAENSSFSFITRELGSAGSLSMLKHVAAVGRRDASVTQ